MSETITGSLGSSEPGVTAVSAFSRTHQQARAALRRLRGTFRHLARLSLFAMTMSCAAGCLDTPPEYSEPTRIPPVILTSLVDPPPTTLYATSASTIDFKVPFHADDVGERLLSVFVLDVGLAAPTVIAEPQVVPVDEPFAEQKKRVLEYPWPWNNDPRLVGCHTMTAIISDQDNVSFYHTTDPLLETRVTWFLWLQDPSATTDTVSVDCFLHTAAGATP
jgi:hypothetical protein